MKRPKAKPVKDVVTAVRVHRVELRRAAKAARMLKLTRNGFIVLAMREKSEATIGASASAA